MRYDITLKELLQEAPTRLMERIAGSPVREWINVEVPRQMARLDLNAWLIDGTLFHLELQGDNDLDIQKRMLGYYSAEWSWFDTPPVQVVLYVGGKPMLMPDWVFHRRLAFGYEIIDIRNLDADEFLNSGQLGDTLVAILCDMRDRKTVIRRILEWISRLSEPKRSESMSRLMVLSGLRKLERAIQEEAKQMPITIDLMENEVFREMFLQKEQEGLDKGLVQGEAKGKVEEAVRFLQRLLEHRFGPLPPWAMERLRQADLEALEAWGLRLLEAASLEETLTYRS